MATGVNVKMGVTGVGEFKRSINDAQSAVKTLDEELKLNAAMLALNGDQERYMENQAGLLNAKLEAQKKVVAETEAALQAMKSQGVDQSSSAFQTMEQKLYKATTEMTKTKSQIKELGDNAGNASTNAGQMNESLQGIGKGISWENVTSGLKSITDSLSSAASKAVNLGKKLYSAVKDSTEWADDVMTRATKYGVDAETVQRMDNVAEIIDTDADTILAAKKKLAKNGDLDELLGVDTGGMSLDDKLWAAADALMAIDDEAEQSELAQKLFGKNYDDLLPLFTTGREAYEAMLADESVLSNAQVQTLGETDDTIKQLEQEVTNLKNAFIADNAETITKLFQWLIDNKDGVIAALTAIGASFAALKIAEFATNLTKIVTGFQTLSGLGNAGNGLSLTGAAGGASSAGTAGASSIAGGLSSALQYVPAVAGMAAIGAGVSWAMNQRVNHAEDVRGTEENVAARTAGLEMALADYILAQQELERAESGANDFMDDFDALNAKVQETYDALIGSEGGQDALQAYSDWRQENAMGNMDWELPDYLAQLLEDVSNSTADAAENGITSSDLDAFNSVPGAMADAVRSGVSNIKVVLDGETVGYLVAPYVSQSIARGIN